MKIIWTASAQKRMDEIFDWYAEKSEKVAVKIYNEILDAVEPLTKFPQMAPIESFLVDCIEDYRSLVVRDIFKIIYFVDYQKK